MNKLPTTNKTNWWISMISVKISLAFVITFVLALAAYFISSIESLASFGNILPSIFILITTLCLLGVSSFQNPAKASPNNTSSAPARAEPSSQNGEVGTLYVGNLAYKANEETVQEYFEKVGTVKSVRLVKDKRTGRRKGFGFIEINTSDQDKFISALNESEFMERNIIVRPANDKQH
jgi:glucan phosphoethanolaminetransferase (alkaline phosphatase superfamily)